MLSQLLRDAKKLSSPKRAKANAWFFKTGPGEYGEGDEFIGLNLPQQRLLVKKYQDLKLSEIQKLLSSKIHEHRLMALLILDLQFKKADEARRNKLVGFYLQNTKNINNWDLVDSSAPYILGVYLLDKPRQIIYNLARSKNLWEKRISMITTLRFIANNQFEDTFKIAEILLNDEHDLIHKAIGWTLREVGKKDFDAETKFLDKHYRTMPRTSLRYAIERFPEKLKAHYMKR